MSSSEKVFIEEFLVLGGEHHGEVWLGEYVTNTIAIPANLRRMGKFYGRDAQAEITIPVTDSHFITEWKGKDGKIYLIASISPTSAYNIDDEISKVSPPLRPIDGERPKVYPADNVTISGFAILRESKTVRSITEIIDAINAELNNSWRAGLTVSENNNMIVITAHCLECEADTVETLIGRALALIGYDFSVNR